PTNPSVRGEPPPPFRPGPRRDLVNIAGLLGGTDETVESAAVGGDVPEPQADPDGVNPPTFAVEVGEVVGDGPVRVDGLDVAHDFPVGRTRTATHRISSGQCDGLGALRNQAPA